MKKERVFATVIPYIAKKKNTMPKEIWLFLKFGRKIEPLEDVDFSRN